MAGELGYNPTAEFAEESIDALVDINCNGSTELWLIQLPEDHGPDFDGQEVTLNLHEDGQLGSVEGASGKLYSMLSYSSQESDATVFLPSSSRPRIAGKISRHVSLVHYPEPEELRPGAKDAKKQMPFSSATSFSKSHMMSAPSQTTSQKNPHSQSRSRSTHTSNSSRKKWSVRSRRCIEIFKKEFRRSFCPRLGTGKWDHHFRILGAISKKKSKK